MGAVFLANVEIGQAIVKKELQVPYLILDGEKFVEYPDIRDRQAGEATQSKPIWLSPAHISSPTTLFSNNYTL